MATDWAKDVKKYAANADDAAIAGIVRYCGIALRNRDSSLVSFSDPTELARVRNNYLKKKLGLTHADDVLDAAIAKVGEQMKADRTKNRVTVYYLLAEAQDKLGLFIKAASAKADKAAKAPTKTEKVPKADKPATKGKAAGAAALSGAAVAATAAKPAKAAAKSKDAAPTKAAAAKPAAAKTEPKAAPAKKAAAPKAEKAAPTKAAPKAKSAKAAGTAAAGGAALLAANLGDKAAGSASKAKDVAADAVKDTAAKGAAAVASAASTAGDAASAAVGGAADLASKAAGVVGDAAGSAVDAVGAGAAAVAGAGAAAVAGAAGLASGAADKLGSAASGAVSQLTGGGDDDDSSGLGWLWWVLGALLVAFVIWWLMFRSPADSTASAPGAEASVAVDSAPAGQAVDLATAPAEGTVTIPTGAGVTSELRDGKPVVKVYFDTGKVDVVPAFGATAGGLKAWLDGHAGSSLAISGYNDASGNAAANAELSKNRAKAVQAALVASGIPDASALLVKPENTTDTSVAKDAARRVEVVVK